MLRTEKIRIATQNGSNCVDVEVLGVQLLFQPSSNERSKLNQYSLLGFELQVVQISHSGYCRHLQLFV